MYTTVLLALAPIAAQAAAQSARWPVFNLRANVTEQYVGYGSPDWDRRDFWHNAPIAGSSDGEITGPLIDDDCTYQRAGLNDHGKQLPIALGFACGLLLANVTTQNKLSLTYT